MPAVPQFMMYFSPTSYEAYVALGKPEYFYDGMLWLVEEEFLTGESDPTEEYYSANGWLSVGGPPVFSEIETGFPTSFGFGFLSDFIEMEDTVVDADNRRVFHGIGWFERREPGPFSPPFQPQGTEVQSWKDAYMPAPPPSQVDLVLGHPPSHNQTQQIDVEYSTDPDTPQLITSVTVGPSGSLPAAGVTPATFDPFPGLWRATTTVEFFGVERTLEGRAAFRTYRRSFGGTMAYPYTGDCYQGNIIGGAFHWEFGFSMPGAAGHSVYGFFDYESVCNPDPGPCKAATFNLDNVPDCVLYGPPCSMQSLPGQINPPDQNGVPGCGFIIPSGGGSVGALAFSERLDPCEAAFGEKCPSGSASDLFSSANSYNGLINPDNSSSYNLCGISISYDDTGMAPYRITPELEANRPAGTQLPQSALEAIVHV